VITPVDLLAVLPPHPIVLEAGAHRGEDTAKFAAVAGHVHAFEPVATLFDSLDHIARRHENVTAYQLALGGANGVQKMWLASGRHQASSSLLTPTGHRMVFPEIAFKKTVSVRVMTLRSWAEMENVERLDGAWLDMQGVELAMLKAAGPILNTVTGIVLEVSLTELYEGMPLWPEVREWLEEREFSVVAEDLYHEHFGDVLVAR
jgi:FkbM family methyltransferase